jgi:hypothetical protein
MIIHVRVFYKKLSIPHLPSDLINAKILCQAFARLDTEPIKAYIDDML